MNLPAISGNLHGRSVDLLWSLEMRLNRIILGWLFVAGLAAAVRIESNRLETSLGADGLPPYLLLVVAPIACILLALRWFADGERSPQPSFRIAQVGRWRTLSADEVTTHPLYGTTGIMFSLLVGMLLNIPVRAGEYLLAMPAISGPVPPWLSVLHTMMTIDVVLLSSLYGIAFVAALRKLPLFPRLLVAVWMIDIAMQLLIAQMVAATPGLPGSVAQALQSLLAGNLNKVLISAALWLPYLLLSTRVKVTYRRRIPA
ncbi:DUF2569 family protein [Sphingomonas sp.]|uniref:DUF2569 family protein n=1 Tax=Sphingomonas sp. TaxID=28214 RepID=UPI0017C76311|nr:DUF2569 family protein [Sphingomonas sp.]MBA3511790.1 DUF2569 family protein [Sphingomonas sp.]